MDAAVHPTRRIVVSGDITIDWNLAYAGAAAGSRSGWDAWTRACWQPGGAALLADVIQVIAAEVSQPDGAEWVVHRQAVPGDVVCPDDAHFHHSYAMWRPFKYGEKPPLDKQYAWRAERFLGFHPHPPDRDSKWAWVVGDPPQPDLVVLDDAGLGFRNVPDLWPQAVAAEEARCPWIVMKVARPVAHGPLWERLHRYHAERLIVVMTVNDLRRTEVQISRELSWERTAQDVAWELVHNPRVNALAHCAAVVISFGPAGAMLMHRPPGSSVTDATSTPVEFRLFFDPAVIEGMWEQDYPGSMIGYNTCLTASVARQSMLDPAKPDLSQAIQAGLSAMRTLHREGYGKRGARVEKVQLVFPIRQIVEKLATCPGEFAAVPVQDPVRSLTPPSAQAGKAAPPALWTILGDHYRGSLEQIAAQVVLEGAERALKEVPLGQFGQLLTVDRQEIESFRSIRSLVKEYANQPQERPLSIAVFGAPGSGKSFGITQVASSLLPDQIKKIEFNLSQLAGPAELLAALHQVRDIGLSGKLPLVFWDEFDTTLERQPLGWLRYFLAPMQDGAFQEGQLTHPIGRAIFIFAGGSCQRMEDFPLATTGDFRGRGLDPDEARAAEQFKAVKGPDFVSRLKGFVDILGPNPQGPADAFYLIRRALLLRSIFQRQRPALFDPPSDGVSRLNIDAGVLRALLHTRVYRHGVRSMEAIVATSLLAGARSFERSSLPSEAQLELHVDGQDFLALVQRIVLEGDVLERLAAAAHGVYDKGKAASPDKPYLGRPYNDLPESVKEENRANVRDIVNKLDTIGYVMRPARSHMAAGDLSDADVERLAEMEHERWMKMKQEAGWRYAPRRDNDKRHHPDLVPWDLLPEAEKQPNRDLVRGIPEILALAGYTLAKVRPQTSSTGCDPAGQPALVLGVTGHRILAELPKLSAGIYTALSHIEQAFPGRRLTLISALAEGADRLVAAQVLNRPGARLVAALPLPRDDYVTDFGTETSRREFAGLLEQACAVVELPPAPSREAAYEAGGRFVLEHCHAMIVVWDGQGAQGQGGSGEIVAEARRRGLPIAWVHAGNRKPGTEEPTSLGEEQGTVTFEGFLSKT